MAEWLDACGEDDLIAAGCLSVPVEGRLVALFRHDGSYYAMQGICTHGSATLTKGKFENGEVICPLHQGRFCVKTGEATGGPVWDDLKTYQVRAENGRILVQLG
ncbi:Rieske 2Fe-2S domain-containing protein [Novosphingobium olei]|uniref:Non-heme iron oxygenase ferredoxin subunit n=1 Tax=Novosphingobium olei TaxID=2728851 RepID=A0A7Y0BL64_9SPHN|nr:non-heme iron oxygenase ferredoxin subunit [Novosphingobium olei]